MTDPTSRLNQMDEISADGWVTGNGFDPVEASLIGLNSAQSAAVTHTGTPLLIVAGAGSGKTRVLTRRIAYLLAAGKARPHEILAITFTNKAAAEMRGRVEQLVGSEARSMTVSTFHSACARFLRRDADQIGYTKSFTIYDQGDSVTLVKRVLEELNHDIKIHKPRSVMAAISNAKNVLIAPAEFSQMAGNYAERIQAEVYTRYQERLKSSNCMDFDDLIWNFVRLLKEHPDVAASYRRRFRHVMVDEYQDTNMAQYEMIRQIVGVDHPAEMAELCVVGDADQSIYAFRGATIRNIDEFEHDFKNAKTILLEQNYRSTQNILSAANTVIANNKDRREKRLWSEAGDGDPLRIYVGDNEHDEAAFIGSEIEQLQNRLGFSLSDVAIFYRTNSQSRAIEESLIRLGLPYKVVGGTRFYERAEIKDMIAYLRVVVNPADEISLRRILNVPTRGVGPKAETALTDYAAANGLTFFDALLMVEAVQGIQTRAVNSIKRFTTLVHDLQSLNDAGSGPTRILAAILEQSGYLTELQLSKDPQDESRIDNIGELENIAREFELTQDPDAGEEIFGLDAFLERISLVADADQIPDAGSGQATLMTLHSAKGLEFPIVFMTGMEEGLFPHARAWEDPAEMQEERRLAYVGITRSEKRLYLTRAEARSRWGSSEYNSPSRFLDEIPEDLVVWLRGDREAKKATSTSSTDPKRATDQMLKRLSPDRAAKEFDLVPGDKVRHQKFGVGIVREIAGEGDRAQVTVDFGPPHNEKRLILRYAPVTKVE
jgi:DNA helicase II / ATP-dependent DNA helicase PcrA